MTDGWRDLPTLADVAAAQAAGDEIEIGIASMKGGCLVYSYEKWRGKYWDTNCKFRARPAQPKMKKVKILGWVDTISGKTFTAIDGWAISGDAIRYPKLDDEIEVPE